MTLHEIARRLYKPGWADLAEFRAALDALGKLSVNQIVEVETIGQRYGRKS